MIIFMVFRNSTNQKKGGKMLLSDWLFQYCKDYSMENEVVLQNR
jgi:hypothetical protein